VLLLPLLVPSVCLLACSAGAYSGCVINPARVLDPALVFGMSMSSVAVYVAGQMAGGALAAMLAGIIHRE
jgi:glycerol uptake facilitator-like aquaporin